MEGNMRKKSAWIGKWSTRYCRIVDNLLVYYHKDMTDKHGVPSKEPLGTINLRDASAKVSRKNDFTFSLTTKYPQKKIFFEAESVLARDMWMDSLVAAGGQYTYTRSQVDVDDEEEAQYDNYNHEEEDGHEENHSGASFQKQDTAGSINTINQQQNGNKSNVKSNVSSTTKSNVKSNLVNSGSLNVGNRSRSNSSSSMGTRSNSMNSNNTKHNTKEEITSKYSNVNSTKNEPKKPVNKLLSPSGNKENASVYNAMGMGQEGLRPGKLQSPGVKSTPNKGSVVVGGGIGNGSVSGASIAAIGGNWALDPSKSFKTKKTKTRRTRSLSNTSNIITKPSSKSATKSESTFAVLATTSSSSAGFNDTESMKECAKESMQESAKVHVKESANEPVKESANEPLVHMGAAKSEPSTDAAVAVPVTIAEEEEKPENSGSSTKIKLLPESSVGLVSSQEPLRLPYRAVNDLSSSEQPCLVFIGGFPCGLHSWDSIISHIPKHIKCIVACAPGLDASCYTQPSAPDGGLSHEAMSSRLLNTIKVVSPVRPAVLVVQGGAVQWALGAATINKREGGNVIKKTFESDKLFGNHPESNKIIENTHESGDAIEKIVVVQMEKLEKAEAVALKCAVIACNSTHSTTSPNSYNDKRGKVSNNKNNNKPSWFSPSSWSLFRASRTALRMVYMGVSYPRHAALAGVYVIGQRVSARLAQVVFGTIVGHKWLPVVRRNSLSTDLLPRRNWEITWDMCYPFYHTFADLVSPSRLSTRVASMNASGNNNNNNSDSQLTAQAPYSEARKMPVVSVLVPAARSFLWRNVRVGVPNLSYVPVVLFQTAGVCTEALTVGTGGNKRALIQEDVAKYLSSAAAASH